MREALTGKKEDIWTKAYPETSKKEFIGKETNYSLRYAKYNKSSAQKTVLFFL